MKSNKLVLNSRKTKYMFDKMRRDEMGVDEVYSKL